jgi:hypothetical protein
MQMGCDLAYVFCTQSAAPVIKGYSPELIVMPMLPESEVGLHAWHSWLAQLSFMACTIAVHGLHNCCSWLANIPFMACTNSNATGNSHGRQAAFMAGAASACSAPLQTE